jgi:predicted Zn-dependent protease
VNRTFALLLCLIALVAGWVVYSRVSPQPTSASASLAPKVEGSKIYFVPIGDFPVDQLQTLVQYYHEKFGLEITVANSIPVDPATRDASRQQLMAENLAASLRNSVPEHGAEPGSILIGFTSEDIYPTTKNWRFAFGWRLGEARSAVVSSARLSLPDIGQPLERDLPGKRLRKIVTKDIGILYYGLPQSQNPKSVLYNQIMGIEELDEVGEDF